MLTRHLIVLLKTILIPAFALAALLTLGGCETQPQKLHKQGLTLYGQADYKGALDKFDAALNFDEFDAQNNYDAGMTQFKLGNYEQASYHFKLAWQKDPSMADVKQALTETLIRMGQPDKALDFLERDAALTEQVKDPSELKKRDNRRYIYQTEEGMFNGHVADRLRVAKIYERLADFDNAKLNYEKARELAPKDPTVLMALGNFYDRVGNKPAAAQAYTQVYRIDPKTPGLVEALTRNGITISSLIQK